MSSAQAIARAKARLGLKKIGHAGTLDPHATGLLVCFTGRATRCAHWLEQGEKEYIGQFTFGIASSTDDIWGEIIENGKPIPDPRDVVVAKERFMGAIEQIPPQVSAIKIGGTPCYKMARRGEQVTISPRRVTVREFELVAEGAEGQYSFRIVCSAGTYIRALARDLGAAVGSAAVVSELRRTRSMPFTVEAAVKLDQLRCEDILPWHLAFSQHESIRVADSALQRIGSGDERVLYGELERANLLQRPIGYSVLFGSDFGGEPRGLVVREAHGWRIGINFMQP